MNERRVRLIFATVLLVALYFDLRFVIYGLIALSLLHGLLPSRFIPPAVRASSGHPGSAEPVGARINIEAERGLSVLVAVTLFCGSVLFTSSLWELPWFVGFTLFGAGLSGVCPMVICLKRIGLK